MYTKLVEDKDKTGTGEVLRQGQQTKLSSCTTSDEQWSEKLYCRTIQFCVVFKIPHSFCIQLVKQLPKTPHSLSFFSFSLPFSLVNPCTNYNAKKKNWSTLSVWPHSLRWKSHAKDKSHERRMSTVEGDGSTPVLQRQQFHHLYLMSKTISNWKDAVIESKLQRRQMQAAKQVGKRGEEVQKSLDAFLERINHAENVPVLVWCRVGDMIKCIWTTECPAWSEVIIYNSRSLFVSPCQLVAIVFLCLSLKYVFLFVCPLLE